MNRNRKLAAAAAVLVAAVAVAASSSALGGGFVGDDRYLVVDNPLLSADTPWPELLLGRWGGRAGGAFERRMNAGYYRPASAAALRLERRLFGDSPAGYHAVSVALHALASLLVLALALRVAPPAGAGIAGLVFAAHAVHAEPVAAIHYQTTLLSGLFVLAALAVNARRPEGARGSPVRGTATALLYALALGSKEEAIVLPALLFLYDAAIRGERPRALLRPRYLALFAIAAAYLVLRARLAPEQGFTYFRDETPYERVATMLGVFGLYARLLVLPHPLCPFYEWSILPPARSVLEPLALAGIAAAAALAAGVAIAGAVVRRGGAPDRVAAARAALFALLFVPVSLLPFSQVIPILNVAAERFLYVGSAGFAVLVGLAGARALGRGRAPVRAAAAALLGGYVLLLGGLSHARGLDWRSDEALHAATVRDFPESLSARLALAELALSRGRWDEARRHAEAAIRISPGLERARELERAATARGGAPDQGSP